MRKLALACSLMLALTTLSCTSAGNAVTEGAVTDQAISFPLHSEGNAHISGTAMLLPRGNQTEVLISLTGEPTGASQPAHIHEGQCGPSLGKVVYPLKSVEDGRSDTTVNAPLSSLTNGHYAINVHQSAQNLGTSVACGAIPSAKK